LKNSELLDVARKLQTVTENSFVQFVSENQVWVISLLRVLRDVFDTVLDIGLENYLS